MTNSGSPNERPRIDKWLWCARFYKSRALASDAVAGGRVHLNGERVKPAHSVRAGDQIEITRASESWTIRVLAIPARRGSASAAARCYEEAADSIARRDADSWAGRRRGHRQSPTSVRVARCCGCCANNDPVPLPSSGIAKPAIVIPECVQHIVIAARACDGLCGSSATGGLTCREQEEAQRMRTG